jgi:uncharacterized membrane protein YkvA (DUF1232 family)
MIENLKQWARSIKRDAHALYLAARHPQTPWYAKGLAIAVAAYALSPIDIIPDFIPIIGLLDEALLLPLAIVGVLKLIPADIIAESRAIAVRAAAAQPVSWAAAGFIATVWGVAIVGTAWLTLKWSVGLLQQ